MVNSLLLPYVKNVGTCFSICHMNKMAAYAKQSNSWASNIE